MIISPQFGRSQAQLKMAAIDSVLVISGPNVNYVAVISLAFFQSEIVTAAEYLDYNNRSI